MSVKNMMIYGGMYSGVECRVTLSVYPTPGKLKNLPDHGGNGTRDLWFASPMLCQLSYEVKSVPQCVIFWTGAAEDR